MSTNSVTPALGLTPPHGLDQILAAFADIFDYIGREHTLNPRWQNESLQRIALPFPLVLSWDKSRRMNQFTCHKRLAEIFTATFTAIQTAGLQDKITTFGGCFSFRPQRTRAKLSAHSWAIAIDLNTESNPQGSAGNTDPAIVEIFRTQDSSGEEAGTANRKIRCISTSALGIDVQL
jgi:hypothetical protein